MAPNGKAGMDFFKSSAFDERVKEVMEEWHVPGMSLTLVHEQELSSKAFGFATLDPPMKCTPDTLFDLASVSKSTTAGAVALLVDDDQKYPHVQWDTPMSRILTDDFVMAEEEYTKSVTIEDVLSHRSGLPSHDDFYFGARSSHPDSPRSVTRNLRNLPISCPIRTKEQYNNSMYTVASYLVEFLTSTSFNDFLHERIWKPLGMSSTNLQPSVANKAGLHDRMATPYQWKEGQNVHKALDYEETPESQGAGSIWTSSKDYALWVKAVMNQEAPITKEIYKALTKPRIISNPDDEELDPFTSYQSYCLGLETFFYRGYAVVQHDGLISGFSSVHFFLPEFKIGGAIFGNSENAGSIGNVLLKEVIDEILQVSNPERVDWNTRQHKSEDNYKNRQKEEQEKLRKELSANGDGVAEQLNIPLSAYTGEYWNVGYKGMKIQIKDGHLYIDATDRSMAFTLDIEHIAGNTLFIGTIYDALTAGEEVDKIKVEFRFDANNPVVRMGVDQESSLDELIWYDKVQESLSREEQQQIAMR